MDLQFLVRLGLFHVLRNRARVNPIPVVAKAARARLEDISAPAAGEALGTDELRNGLLLDWPNSGPQHVLASYVQEPSRMVPVCFVCVSVLSVCVCYICVVCVVLSACVCVHASLALALSPFPHYTHACGRYQGLTGLLATTTTVSVCGIHMYRMWRFEETREVCCRCTSVTPLSKISALIYLLNVPKV